MRKVDSRDEGSHCIDQALNKSGGTQESLANGSAFGCHNMDTSHFVWSP